MPSSIITSTTSSTVTNPTTLPSFSRTGTASRLYLAIFPATTSWSSRALTVTGFLRITRSTGWSRSAITRSLSETGAEQVPGARLHHVAGVDRLLLPGHRADVLQAVADRPGRLEPHELGGHDAARAVGRVLQEALDLGPHLGGELGQQAPARDLAHPADDLGALVRGEALEDLGGAAGVHLPEDRAAAVERGLVEDLDRPRHRQHAHHRGRLLPGELVDEVGDVGRLQLRHDLADPDEALVQPQADALEQVLGSAHAVSFSSSPRRASQRCRSSSRSSVKRGSVRRGSSFGVWAKRG